jgi:6-phosphogluconolactonase
MIHFANIIITKDADRLAVAGAELFRRYARRSIERSGRFAAAISGGSTPRGVHRMLARQPYKSEILWDRVHLFWVDERLVSAKHPASNYGAAKKDFLTAVSIPAEQVHPMTSFEPPPEAAADYRRKLEAGFEGSADRLPRFDLVFLGIGQDGHTASIFPRDTAAEATDLPVIAVKGGNPNVFRLTLSIPVLNRAACIVFIVSGKRKAQVTKKLLTGKAPQLPAERILPANGRLIWLLDQDAAGALDLARPY